MHHNHECVSPQGHVNLKQLNTNKISPNCFIFSYQ